MYSFLNKNMNEMFNSTASLLPLMLIDNKNNLYLNISIIGFSIIGSFSHMFPENLKGATHLVKAMISNIFFALLKLNPILGMSLSFLDLFPLIFQQKILLNQIGEKILQIPRQIIEIYFVSQIYLFFPYRVIFIILCKIIYFIERRLRIKRKERNNFYFWHCFQHFGFYLLISTIVDIYPYNIILFIKMFLCFMFFWSLLILGFTYYLILFYDQRAPNWLKQDEILIAILNAKLQKNFYKGKFHNYICKPWTYHLKMEIITWQKIELICQEIIKQIDVSNIDAIVGIATGGAFVGAYLGKLLNIKYYIIYSKLWSGTNFLENSQKAIGFYMGQNISPEISGLPQIKGKKVLLCDDTTYTGITMLKCKKYCLEVLNASDVKTFNLWIHGRFIPDYYFSKKRVPIFWEWGAEMD